jgi:hypothetical protein
MSPEAVTARLLLMGELCESSTKLAYEKWVAEQRAEPESDAKSLETEEDGSESEPRAVATRHRRPLAK